MANADGTITLQTAVDTKGIKQGEAQIKNSAQSMGSSFKRLGGIIATAFSVYAIKNFMSQAREAYKLQFEAESKLAVIMRQRLGSTDKQIRAILDLTAAEQKMGVVGDEVQLAGAQQLATFVKEQSSLEKLIPAMNDVLVQQNGLNVSSGAAVGIANLFGKAMMGQAASLRRVGITFDESQEKVLKYGNEEQRAAMLAQVITQNVGHMNYALAQTDFGKQQQLANTLGDIKEKFGQAVQQLLVAFIPLLKVGLQLLNGLADTLQWVGEKVSTFFGGSKTSDSIKDTVVQTGNLTKGIKGATAATAANTKANQANTKSYDGLTKATKNNDKANKKAKKTTKRTIADYDKLRLIQKQVSKQAAKNAKAAKTPSVSGGGIGDLGSIGGVSTAPISGKGMDNLTKEEKRRLGMIQAVAGMFLAAIGMILLVTGHIPLGIGLIIAGIAVFKAGVANIKDSGLDKQTKDLLTKIGLIAGGALVAIGLILCLTGVGVPLGLGMILAGGTALAGVVDLNWDYLKDKVSGAWDAIVTWFDQNVVNSSVVQGIKNFYDETLKPIGDKIAKKLGEFWTNTLKPFWEKYLKPLLGSIGTGLKDAWNNVVWPTLKTIGKIIGQIMETIANVIEHAVDLITDMLGALFDAFDGTIDGFKALFRGDLKEAGEIGIKTLGKWKTSIENIFIDIVNLIIDGLNAVIGLYNEANSWLSEIFGMKAPAETPKIEHLEHGVSSFESAMNKALAGANLGGGGHSGGAFGVVGGQQDVSVEINVDGDRLGKVVAKVNNKKKKQTGKRK